jgi:hypothetical protein
MNLDYSTLLRDRVTLKIDCIDRIFMQAWMPKLQTVGQVCTFLCRRRKFKIPTSGAFGKICNEFVESIQLFAKADNIPVVYFKKGEKKERVAQQYLEAAAREGKSKVVMIGIAQEKASAWRSWKAKGQEKKLHPHMQWARQMVFVNHYYFYIWDSEWGPAFWKTNGYAPYPVWIWLNGHEWAKRRLEKKGIAYKALDNGFRSCEDPVELQEICNRLGPGAVKNFFWKWVHILPSPFTNSETRAGYVYELSFRQFEVSQTSVFDRPQAGRMWFESVIRDHLDIGRPDEITLIFDRRIRKRKAEFRTRVILDGVNPTLYGRYKSSKIKQYFKEGWALRTETTINDTHDFKIGRRVCAKNWKALIAVGRLANRRLCDDEAADAMPAPDVVTFDKVTRPSTTDDGLYSPSLRFGDHRAMAVLASLLAFCFVIDGFTNSELVARVSALLNRLYTPRQATYDLRKLKRKGLILRCQGKHRYQLTPTGRRVAVLFTKTYQRVLTPALTALDPALPEPVIPRSPLACAWRRFEHTLDEYIEKQLLAA